MNIVYKYAVDFKETFIKLPIGAKFALLGKQESTFYAWFEIDVNERRTENRVFELMPTGFSFEGKRWSSIQDGQFVWHLVETTKKEK